MFSNDQQPSEKSELAQTTLKGPQRKKRARALIADLPNGVSAYKNANGKGSTYFTVRLGKKFTQGDTLTKNFKTVEGAREWVDRQIASRQTIVALHLTPDQLASARAAYSRLPDGVLLNDVVSFYLHHKPERAPTLLADAVERYLKEKLEIGNDESYIYKERVALGVLSRSFPGSDLDFLTPVALSAWFKQKNWKVVNQSNYFRDLGMFFKWCFRQDLVSSNPMEKAELDWVRQARKKSIKSAVKPTIYSVDEARRLLRTARDHPELELLAWLAATLFTGVRIEETVRLRWSNFRFDEGIVMVTEEVVKKISRPRNVTMSEPFLDWVALVKARDGKFLTKTSFRQRKEKLYQLAKVPKKRNALRHSFGSYHYVYFGDSNKTRAEMGHDHPQTLFTSYVQLVSKREAEEFWDLRSSV